MQSTILHFVKEVVKSGNSFLESLALSGVGHDNVGFRGGIARVSGEDLPVIEHTLREGLSSSVGAEIGGES